MCSEHGKQGGGAGSRSRGSDDGRTTRDRTPVQGRGPSLRDGKLRRARSRGLLHRLQLAVHTDGHQTETNPGESQQKGGCRAGGDSRGGHSRGNCDRGVSRGLRLSEPTELHAPDLCTPRRECTYSSESGAGKAQGASPTSARGALRHSNCGTLTTLGDARPRFPL